MRRALFLLPLLFVGGCISLLPEPPPTPRVFALEARDVVRAEGAPIAETITVAEPTGEDAIMGASLVWRTGDQMASIAQTQWSDDASDALQAMLVETLIRQGRFASAARTGDARGRYEVRWDILDFQVDEASMQARFVANVRLNAPGRRIIAQEIISTEAPVSSRSSSEAAQALARAAREGSARIGMFAADRAAQDIAASPARTQERPAP
jgi:ABC-type uncharacterized transport system auxiliary subunit